MGRLEALTCLLYDSKGSSTDINALRYNLFCAKKGEIESHQLPSCKDCLVKHAQRANYQADILRSLEHVPQVPRPDERLIKKMVQKQSSWWLIEWMVSQHWKLSWCYWLANAHGMYTTKCVWQID